MTDLNKLIEYKAPENLLSNRNILVTGAGDGIGRAAACCYARHGATVILLGRNTEKLEACYDAIESAGAPQAAIMPMDLATCSDEEFTHLSAEIASEIGPLHGLLHNAGELGDIKPLQQLTTAEWDHLVRINLSCNFSLTRALLPNLMAAEDASVIFTSSGVGRKARAYWGAYAVSKFGIEGLAQVWADELDNTSSIRVNTLNPGATNTAMRRSAYPAEPPEQNPMPDDIMGAYLFLMGADSTGINGQQLNAQAKR